MLMSPLRFGQSPLSTSPSGGTGGGMSLEELMKSAETAANYKLMHDIATDNTFKLSPRQPLPDRSEKFSSAPIFHHMITSDIS